MKALVLNGAHEGEDALDAVCDVVVNELLRRSWQVELLTLRSMELAPCVGCFGCWIDDPGRCLNGNDDGRSIAMKFSQSNLVAMTTSVTFGGYSSELKKALDRAIGNLLPFFAKVDGEVHHEPRYESSPFIIALGMMPGPDAEAERIFTNLVRRNALNLHSPLHSSGAVYPDQTPETVRSELVRHLTKIGAWA